MEYFNGVVLMGEYLELERDEDRIVTYRGIEYTLSYIRVRDEIWNSECDYPVLIPNGVKFIEFMLKNPTKYILISGKLKVIEEEDASYIVVNKLRFINEEDMMNGLVKNKKSVEKLLGYLFNTEI